MACDFIPRVGWHKIDTVCYCEQRFSGNKTANHLDDLLVELETFNSFGLDHLVHEVVTVKK